MIGQSFVGLIVLFNDFFAVFRLLNFNDIILFSIIDF